MFFNKACKSNECFVTPFGHSQFTVMPFEMVNSGASFVRLMKMVAYFSLHLSWRTQFAIIKNKNVINEKNIKIEFNPMHFFLIPL